MPPVNLAADKVRRLPVDGATPQFVQFGVAIGSLDVAVAPVASLHAGAPRGGGRRRSRHLSGTSKSPLTARRARAPPLPLSPRPCHSCQKRIKAAVSRGDPEVGGSDRGRLAALAEGGASIWMAVHAPRGRRADPAFWSPRLAQSRTRHPTPSACLLVRSRLGCCSSCVHPRALRGATPLGRGVALERAAHLAKHRGDESHRQPPVCGGPALEAEGGACRGGPRLDNEEGR